MLRDLINKIIQLLTENETEKYLRKLFEAKFIGKTIVIKPAVFKWMLGQETAFNLGKNVGYHYGHFNNRDTGAYVDVALLGFNDEIIYDSGDNDGGVYSGFSGRQEGILFDYVNRIQESGQFVGYKIEVF